MFGLFARKNDEPFEQTIEMEFNAPAEDLFRLLDFESPNNHMFHRGLDRADRDMPAGHFAFQSPDMPELTFLFEVTQRDAPTTIEFISRVEGDMPGALVETFSRYTIAPNGADRCVLSHHNASTFKSGLSRSKRDEEEAMMTLAVHNDLAQLQIEAESGLGAA